MDYIHIKLTPDELGFVLEILQHTLEDSEPSIALDIADIIEVLREQHPNILAHNPVLCNYI